MPSQSNGVAKLHAKPTTRSSIRHSLNLASVGKALGEIMSKDGDKGLKKESNARRSSTVNLVHNANGSGTSRTSTDTKPSPPRRDNPFDSKTVTRAKVRKLSTTHRSATESSDVNPLIQASSVARPLRPRTSTSSALPRPKSVVVDFGKKPPSPLRAGTRRRLCSSDDEQDEPGTSKETSEGVDQSPTEKMTRAISPLPHRATFKVNLAAVNVAPPSSSSKGKAEPPLSAKISPPRPMKTVKLTSISVSRSTIPRPPSSTSSSSPLPSPRTPKGTSLKNALGMNKSGRENTRRESSPLRTTYRPPPDSPLPRRAQKVSKVTKSGSSPTKSSFAGNMSHISEGKHEDSFDAEDVEMLLAPVASLAAPTPAMPHPQHANNHKPSSPKTPTRRTNKLPTRSNLSYLSPPSPQVESSSSLRPPPQNSRARGSILSWEQLASESSRTLGEDEIGTMLSDVPAPFIADPTSPSPNARSSVTSAPDSPCLSALHSPGGYGSISQVLLPDVTPSPAFHHVQRYENVPSELPAVDAAIVTLLRLQLASAEDTAKERLNRLESLEEELRTLKETHHAETEELGKQVTIIEEQLRRNNDLRDKADEERAAYTASLEEQLTHNQAFFQQAIEDAVLKTNSEAQSIREKALRSERRRWDAACFARGTSDAWKSVRDLAESELEFVRIGMETLSVLLAGLEQTMS